MSVPALIGLIGDVHAEDSLLEQAIEALTGHGAHAIVCVGDIADGPGSLDRCCELLAAHDVLTVAGNHDRTRLEKERRRSAAGDQPVFSERTLRYLAGLPAQRELMTANGKLAVCHGLGDDDLFCLPAGSPDEKSARRLDSFTAGRDLRWVVCGHVHRRQVFAWNDVTFVIAGTLATAFGPGYGLLNVVTGEVVFFDLPVS